MKSSNLRLVIGLTGLVAGVVFMKVSTRPNDFVLAALGAYEVVLWACLRLIDRLTGTLRAKSVAISVVESVLLAILLLLVLGYSRLLAVMLAAISAYRIWLAYSKLGEH